MKTFIGTKIIKAPPQTCPSDIHMSKKGDPGYLVEYENGYQSWSPEDVFDKAYRETNGLPFGLALEAMKKGKCVARKGWNGKNQFIMYCDEKTSYTLSCGTKCKRRPYAYIKTVDNELMPWTPSTSDMFADDWAIVK